MTSTTLAGTGLPTVSTLPPMLRGHRGIHYDFIRKQFPEWLVQADASTHRALGQRALGELPALKTAPDVLTHLHQSYTACLHYQRKVQTVLRTLSTVESFAKPLLEQALKDEFGLTLDAKQTFLYHPTHGIAGNIRSYVSNLLHAALHNYEVAQTREGGLDEPGTAAGIYSENPVNQPNPTLLAISPTRFAALSRRLDLGGQYQKHLDEVFFPGAKAGQSPLEAQHRVRSHFSLHDAYALETQVHIAFLRSHLDPTAYRLMLEIAKGKKCRCPPGTRNAVSA